MKHTPYWWEDGAPAPDLPDAPPAAADLVIVGAGFTGLSGALAAARTGASTVVIDAGVPGEGASTRNGGMMGSLHRVKFRDAVRTYGEATARGLMQEGLAAYEFTRDLIEREGIDCDFQETGRIQLAWTRADHEAQKRLVEDVAEYHPGGARLLSRDELAGEIATDRYFGAVLFPRHGAVHPRKMHDGLLAAARRAGAEVVRDCPVTGVARKDGAFEVTTANGAIRAGAVVMATNGYTAAPFRWLARRVFPLPSYLIATEPLPREVIDRVAPGRRMMVETRARHSYFRVSPDGARILWGGRAAMVPISPERAAARLKATMTEIWPALKDVALTHGWTGNTGFTFAMIPHAGVRDGVHFALGYCGNGVAMSPYLGMKAAMRALGRPEGETVFARTRFEARPWHPLVRPHFLSAADVVFRMTDVEQNLRAWLDRRRKI